MLIKILKDPISTYNPLERELLPKVFRRMFEAEVFDL